MTTLRLLAWDSSAEKIKRTTYDPSTIGVITGTPGCLAFYDSDGNVSPGDSSLFFNSTNNLLGIGTNSPTAGLSVSTLAALPAAYLTAVNTTSSQGILEISNLGAGSDIIRGDANGEIEEKYVHNISLAASSTQQLASSLSFNATTYCGIEISYSVIDDSSAVRVGVLRIANTMTSLSISDDYTETQDIGLTWDATINAGIVGVYYSTNASAKVLRADLKRFKY